MADAEKVEKVISGLYEMALRTSWDDIDSQRHRFQPVLNDAMSVIRELKAENERLRQEKADAVKRIERCRQNCISGEKDCDIAYNKSGKEWYRAKADAYKQALDIINEP